MVSHSASNTGPASLVAVLRQHRQVQPETPVFTFLTDGCSAVRTLSYREVDRQARSIAAALQQRGLRGKRVLLLYVPGLDFISALYGCFYAGVVAVPAYPPEPGRLARALPRLQAIIRDAAPALVLSTSELLEMARIVFDRAPDLATVPREASDRFVAAGLEGAWCERDVAPEDLALIQYTSGSTSIPKGVVVTHGALSINLRMVQQGAGLEPASIISSWLPFYHDFGLIGGIMLPVFSGIRSVLMPPLDFLRRPADWLGSLARFGATDTFVPNFALDLCVRKTTHEERQSLDLGGLQQIVVAAEPVRHSTLERFAEAFALCGLDPKAFCPAYGLAEAVLGVSGGPRRAARSAVFVDADQLRSSRWVELERDHPRARALVGCGRPLPGEELRIVDPQTRLPLPPGHVGELWVSGPNVAGGYWNRPEESAHTFEARLSDGDPRRYLRTGDLAYVRDGELFLVGRIKDIILIRGRNHYPQDIESTVERCHPLVRSGCAAAFAVEDGGEERLALAVEVETRDLRAGDERDAALGEALRSIVGAVSLEHSLRVHAVALIKARTIDKTSSGKIARHASRERFLAGTLQTERLWSAATDTADAPPPRRVAAGERSRSPGIGAALRREAPEARVRMLIDYIEGELREVLGSNAQRLLDRDSSMQEVGLDSLGALDLAGRVEKDLNVALPVGKLLDGMSVRSLVAQLMSDLALPDVHEPQHRTSRCVMALQPVVVRRPLFFVGGAFGSCLYLKPLARAVGVDQPFYALQYPGLGEDEAPLRTVEEIARRFLEDVRAVQPTGPYALGGHSFGGLVAYELAQQLLRRGEQVSHLILADTSPVAKAPPDDGGGDGDGDGDGEMMALFELLNCFLRLDGRLADEGAHVLQALAGMPPDEQRRYLRDALAGQKGVPPGFPLGRLIEIFKSNMTAMRLYRPLPTPLPVVLLRAVGGFPPRSLHPERVMHLRFGEPTFGWEEVARRLRVVDVLGDHFSMVTHPHVAQLGRHLRTCLEDGAPLELGLELPLERRSGAPIQVGQDGRRPNVAFYPFREDYIRDPYPLLDALRTHDPVHWSPIGAWCLTRYRDIAAGLRDRRFSVDKGFLADDARRRADPAWEGSEDGSAPVEVQHAVTSWLSEEANDPFFRFRDNSMMFLDPPRHTRLRRLLAGAFEPAVMRRWRGTIERTTLELLARLKDRPDPDLIRDFAFPLPTRVISEMLGVPREDVPMLQGWAYDVARMIDFIVSKDALRGASLSARNFMEYMRAHVQRHRARGGGESNLLTWMSEADAEGERLTLDELLANCLLLFSAGYITTTNTLGNAVLALSRAPDQARLLREQPHLIERAVEELLRYDGAGRQILRTATEDLVVEDKQIRRGDLVMFMLGAGNRDPEAFPEPNRLDLTRTVKHHLAFAHGIHYCLGASLARIELQVAVLATVQHLPTLRILPDGLRWQRSIALRGLEQMRVAFDGEFG